MNRQIEPLILYLVAAIMGLIFSADICKAGEAAPYTKDAYIKIEKAHKDYIPPRPSNSATPLEKQKVAIERFREIFRLAGYDFDATIQKVADDAKNNPDRIPRGSENVATMVVVLMSFVKSHCEDERINCLDIFDYQTSESIKWLWGHTGFKP